MQIGFEDTAIIKGECFTTGMSGTCRWIGVAYRLLCWSRNAVSA